MGLVIVRMVSLESLHGSHTHYRGKERVLTVGLLTTAPSRVSEDVDVRSPESQSVILLVLSPAYCVVIFCTCLVRNICECLKVGLGIEGRRHTDGLRVDCGKTSPGHTVKGLVPPVVVRNS